MNQIVLERPGELQLREVGEPRAQGECALVRVHRAGVCGTDLHAFEGAQPFFEYPRVLGHELGVEVLDLPPGVSRVAVGDRCAVRPYIDDPASPASRRGKPNCCERLQVLGVHVDGGFCERLALPARLLHPAGELSYDQLALVEPLSIGCHAIERAALVEGEAALVVGVGPIGLGAALFAQLAGAQVTALDLEPERLARCARLCPGVRTVAELEEDQRFECVLDATGNPAATRASFDHVAHGGRLVMVGLFQGELRFPDPEFHKREMTLLASRNATPATFDRVLDALRRGALDAEAWITHRLKLAEVPERFGALGAEAGLLKAMVEL